MNVLVEVASRHGSTQEMAYAIAGELRANGCEASVYTVNPDIDLNPYDAVILGSAIYMGKWLPEAQAFVNRNASRLQSKPVWLFSSGPLGTPDPKPVEELADLPALLEATGARDHQVFVGKLDKRQLGVGERLAVKLVKAPEGDFRDWDAIREWAQGIAATLAREVPSRP